MTKILLVLLTCISTNLFSQQITITGQVIDTSENRPLENAVISLVRSPDSILLKFVRSDKEGKFSLTHSKKVPAILLITYPHYADYVDFVRDTVVSEISFGKITLTKRSELLEAVIVKQKIAAIRMKGDTLEYKADSFTVSQGATVDELLKKLPGIQVNRNGEITAQGQKVNKVLVDGEEFFSDDPAVVVKNLQAEAVKEVQVFDKKSEQSEFTGIDDGERSKTINLTLKPEKKKGYYAKVNLNGGTNESFDNELLANSFKGTSKIAAFGIMSNTGKLGLSWQDNDRFGGGFDVEFNEEEGYFMQQDWDNEFNQHMNEEEGLPAAWSAGLHYSDKWDGDNKKINGNYRFLKKNLNAEGNTITQYILPDTQYFNNQSRKTFNSQTGHQLKGIYDLKFDSLSSMKISVTGKSSQTENASRMESTALNADKGLVNSNDRLLSSQVTKNNFKANVLWRKKFRKKGRTLSLNLEQTAAEQLLDGLLQSGTDYYNNVGEIYDTEQIDQKKENRQNTLGVTSNVVYTEPLSKVLFLSVNYGYTFMKSEAFRNTFNKGGSDDYDIKDSLFSNDFSFRYNVHKAGADIKFNKKKLMLTIGSGINYSSFAQTDLIRDSSSKYSFVNYFPNIHLKISPKQFRQFNLRYNGRNNPPSLDQLQPVRENTDPLNIRLGNPALRQEFAHTLQIFYHDYKLLTQRSIYMSSYSNILQNGISMSTVVDEGGKTTYLPINVDGNFNTGFYGGYGTALKIPGTRLDFGLDFNISRMSNMVNNLSNVNNNRSIGFNTRIEKSKTDKYSFSVRPQVNYIFSKSSLRPDIITKYFTTQTEFSAWSKLPWKLEIWSAANIYTRQKTDVFDVNRDVIKWDANIVKKLLKNNNLQLKFAVFDILNQNLGFNRTATSNFITENSFNTLRRYFMLGVQYHITKNP